MGNGDCWNSIFTFLAFLRAGFPCPAFFPHKQLHHRDDIILIKINILYGDPRQYYEMMRKGIYMSLSKNFYKEHVSESADDDCDAELQDKINKAESEIKKLVGRR